MQNDNFLESRLALRRAEGAFRSLRAGNPGVDFSSNDYLGIVRNKLLHSSASLAHGSTGSRLLTGNYEAMTKLEEKIAFFHESPAALIFNSGYDANLGLLSCVLQKEDIVIYDFLSHASIRDGIRLGKGTAFTFLHNDLADLERRLINTSDRKGSVFVVTESVFSMDGDQAPLAAIAELCEKYQAHLVVDEAHATGITGPNGAGLIQQLSLQQKCFARIHTFGKALGCHGAVVLGSQNLKDYLINFSRALIYTTALPPAAIGAIEQTYQLFPAMDQERKHLDDLIVHFGKAASAYDKLQSSTPIQGVIIPGNEQVKAVSAALLQHGLDVRPILYPTVPKGSERLRIIIHSFNTFDELGILLHHLN